MKSRCGKVVSMPALPSKFCWFDPPLLKPFRCDYDKPKPCFQLDLKLKHSLIQTRAYWYVFITKLKVFKLTRVTKSGYQTDSQVIIFLVFYLVMKKLSFLCQLWCACGQLSTKVPHCSGSRGLLMILAIPNSTAVTGGALLGWPQSHNPPLSPGLYGRWSKGWTGLGQWCIIELTKQMSANYIR